MREALHHLQILIASTVSARSRDDDRGASLVEYALLVALIAIVCFVAVQFLGDETSSGLRDVGNSLAG
jgi:Flp pilus assembly pilin Flp